MKCVKRLLVNVATVDADFLLDEEEAIRLPGSCLMRIKEEIK